MTRSQNLRLRLTAENVVATIKDCFYTAEELAELEKISGQRMPAGAVHVDGVLLTKVGFCPERLERHREDVASMLSELPEQFFKGTGDSFSCAHFTRDGQWWGEHRNVEALLLMAIGLKLAKFVFPRELWSTLPEGIPYFVVLKTPEDEIAKFTFQASKVPLAMKRGTMDEVASMVAARKTCLACKNGDHEVSLGPEEACDCPCHGG